MDFEGKQQSLLTFRVGPVLCCAPSLPVRSIISPPKLTHPPGCDSSQPGIFKHGSDIVKVLDLRQKFGVEKEQQTQPGNLIISIIAKESFAFWVDQILDVFDFPSEGWGNLPAVIPRSVFSRTLLLNKKIYLYSEFEQLATINDLGYLKNYINQLTTQNKKEQKITEENKTDKNKYKKPTINPHSENTEIGSVTEVKSTIEENKNSPTAVVQKQHVKSSALKDTTNNNIKKTDTKKSTLSKATHETFKKTTVMPTPTPTPILTTSPTISVIKPSLKTPVIYKEKSNHNKISVSNENTDNNSSLFGIFVLLIIIVLGVGLYYLFENMTSNNKPTTSIISVIKEKDLFIEKDVPDKENFETINSELDEQDLGKPSKNMIAIDTDSLINRKKQNLLSIQVSEINNEKKSLIKNIESTTYRADITQEDNDITITIHQPFEKNKREEAIKPDSTKLIETAQLIDSNVIYEQISKPSIINKLKKEEIKNTIQPKKEISEVIHTVVKGDTLWAIAKKYVHNPFLYPELARLSNIKNPHRIYPGNRVRIRFIKN